MLRQNAKAATQSFRRHAKAPDGRRCGLCGNARKLRKTECCGRWICDDEDSYVLFSYARNSCSRNHSRYTLCGHHFNERHAGDWRTCETCRADIVTEMYVYYGTNEYNFEKLVDPPAYKPTHCSSCNRVIKLAEEAYSMSSKGYTCSDCFSF
jgi:hypothetical protein